MSELKTIKEYIRVHREIYTKAAINRELRKKGYNWAEIDDAWADVEGVESSTWSKPKTWGVLLGFQFGVPALIGFILRFLGNSTTQLGIPFIVMCILALITGLGVSIFSWNKDRALSRGLLAGVVLSVVLAFIPLFIIVGVCSVGRSVYSF